MWMLILIGVFDYFAVTRKYRSDLSSYLRTSVFVQLTRSPSVVPQPNTWLVENKAGHRTTQTQYQEKLDRSEAEFRTNTYHLVFVSSMGAPPTVNRNQSRTRNGTTSVVTRRSNTLPLGHKEILPLFRRLPPSRPSISRADQRKRLCCVLRCHGAWHRASRPTLQ